MGYKFCFNNAIIHNNIIFKQHAKLIKKHFLDNIKMSIRYKQRDGII